jgi:prepilin-type N-terminal cleavage/methylation domain-containing protein
MLRVKDRFSNLGFRRGRGFTLIELLIVIAIILILIAIALPNFLEAQLRARVTKAKGEMRSIVTAMEAYNIDFRIYPPENENNCLVSGNGRPPWECGLLRLTTPIKYMTSIPEDPFPASGAQENTVYETGGVEDSTRAGGLFDKSALATWAIFSRGPDGDEADINSADTTFGIPADDGSVDGYAPTNGTKSRGDLFHFGGDPLYIGTICGSKLISCARNPASIANGGLGLVVNGQSYIHRLPPGLY